MSRVARKAAARKKLQILLFASCGLAAVLLAVLALILLLNGPDDNPDGVQGSTDTNTVITVTSDPQPTDGPSTDSGSDSDTGSAPSPSDTPTFDFTAWNLIFINPDHALPEDFSVDLVTFSYNGTSGYVDSRCADAFREMFAAAKEAGITLTVRSAYRNFERQETNFNAKVQEYVNKGYSEAEARAVTATIIAVPGTSEHHTGLAMDILTPSYNRLNEGFEDTDAFAWLYEHCAEYGFILRYPKGKTEITKIIYEPWHYRYVGKEAAQIIMSEGICYEEFVEKYGNNVE